MNKSIFARIKNSQELRVAGVVLVLGVLGVIECSRGAWATGLVLLILAVLAVAAYWMFVLRPSRVPRDAVLVLKLSGQLREDGRRSPLDQILRRSAPALAQIRTALEEAARDRQVRALIVRLAGLEVGLATAHELHRLLREVHRAGKRVIAVVSGDQATLREYLVASGAGEIVSNPDTMFMLLGVAAGQPFVKGALDKAHVVAQTLQWREYTGAGEVLSRESMSPELRESLEAVIADWERVLVDAVSSARKLAPEKASELLASGFLSARAAHEAGLIDREGYLEDIRAEFDPDDKRRVFASLGRYLRNLAFRESSSDLPAIGLVYGVGPVIAGDGPTTGEYLSGESTAAQIERASRDDSVRAILFRVNSPGGSAVGSDLVWRAVRDAQRRGKPVVVSMGDVAGSGGYYVAMGADAIVAEPACITGSIGVVFTKLSLGNLMRDLGVHFDFAKSAANSDAMSLSRPMTDAELAQLNGAVGELYGNFTSKVAEGRKLDRERVEEVARGRIWSGVAARERGLIDDVGGFGRAVEIARERAKIPSGQPHRIVEFTGRERLFGLTSLFSSEPASLGLELASRVAGVPSHWAPAMVKLLTRGGALLLCRVFDV